VNADTGRPEAFERFLAGLDFSGQPELAEAMRWSLLAGGKRIRPRLCLGAVAAAGGDPERALPAAAALELVHTFSLVHDDLPALDDDDLRRGRATTHLHFGEGVAILAGDALLNLAYRLVAERLDAPAAVRVAVIGELARGVAGMIDGQYLDVTAGGELGQEELASMHRLKTGALISASVGCGLHVAGIDGDEAAPLRAFAAELGLLFQIVDDVLDATATESELGKPAGSDAAHDKRTYVTVLGLARARELARTSARRVESLLAEVRGETDDLAAVAGSIAGALR
jgi:geranylgeranyl diphosphate synthase type II